MANPGEYEPPGGLKEPVSAPPSPPGGAASSSPGQGPAGTPPRAPAGTPAPPPPAIGAIFRDLFLLLDAQFRIWRLRARGRFVGMCLAAAFFLAVIGLGSWGFVLFDRALDMIIERALDSVIASPLIRGLLYLGGAGWGFYTMYVYGSEDQEKLPPEPTEGSGGQGLGGRG
ncbi:MAG: hypothetical protein HYY93_09440 [Planctomycetes bacterium]|nr:hypothetical protein [Planctomycetota bacterium]